MENFISVDEISVSCNFQIGQIKSLSIKEQMGTHTVAEIVAGVEAGSLNIASQQFNSQPLVIDAVKERERTLLFSGIISKIRIDKEAVYDTIYIMAYSLSWFMDLEKKNKSYQGDISILKLIQKICEENSFSFMSSAEDRITEEPFIQYRETDWEFMVRLSTHLHVPVYAANDYEGRGIYLGLRKQGDPVRLNTLNEKWCMNAERNKLMNFDIKKSLYYEVTAGQVFHLGQSIQYNNEILWPFKVDMVLQNGILYCNYKLAGTYYHAMPACYNPHLRGCSLEGTVLERKDEAIKVHLDIDDEQDLDCAHFYPWFPEYGNMVYCMPEEGSKIRLLISGEDERCAIGIHCVRQNGGICRETQIPDNRWFSTDKNKKLTLQPSIIELSGEEGKSKISFQDSVGNSLRSCGNILIQAKGNVVIQGTKVMMNAPGEITAIKRELGDPAVVNICHNLDAMGKQTTFRNLEELKLKNTQARGRDYSGRQILSEEAKAGKEEEKKKLQFELQKLLKQENEKNGYELGASIVNIISAVPQCPRQDKISQIVMGFRPIAGRMKGD